MNFELSKIIENEPDIIIRDKVDPNIIIYRVNFSNVFIEKPYIQNKNRMKEILYPNIARLKNLNYDSNIKINIKERILVKKTERNEDLKKLLYKSDYVCDNIDCKFKKKTICYKYIFNNDNKFQNKHICIYCYIDNLREIKETKLDQCSNRNCKIKTKRIYCGIHTDNKFYCERCELENFASIIPEGKKIIDYEEDRIEDLRDKDEYVENNYYRIKICKIPMMLGCDYCNLTDLSQKNRVLIGGECPLDKGGYFIVKGTERAIVYQMRNAYNRIIVIKNKTHYVCETRSLSEKTFHSSQIKIYCSLDRKEVLINIPNIKKIYLFLYLYLL